VNSPQTVTVSTPESTSSNVLPGVFAFPGTAGAALSSAGAAAVVAVVAEGEVVVALVAVVAAVAAADGSSSFLSLFDPKSFIPLCTQQRRARARECEGFAPDTKHSQR
jgi:hypothetical protein